MLSYECFDETGLKFWNLNKCKSKMRPHQLGCEVLNQRHPLLMISYTFLDAVMFSKSQHCQDWPLFILQRRRGEPKRHFISLAEIHGNLGWGNSQGSTKYVLFNIWMFNNWKGKAPKFKHMKNNVPKHGILYLLYIYHTHICMCPPLCIIFPNLWKFFFAWRSSKILWSHSKVKFCSQDFILPAHQEWRGGWE